MERFDPTLTSSLFFGLPGILYILVGLIGGKEGEGITVFGVALLALSICCFAFGYLRRVFAEFTITNKRIVMKVGVLKQRTAELFLNKIDSIGVTQSLLGRTLGYGTIVVRGTGGTFEPFDKVPHPLEFRRQVQEQVEKTMKAAA